MDYYKYTAVILNRVIIRSPQIGQNFMTRAQYKQMIGRAGRAGIDSKGESYLIISKPEVENFYLPSTIFLRVITQLLSGTKYLM